MQALLTLQNLDTDLDQPEVDHHVSCTVCLQAMIEEAIENKEQKAKQRQKEYDRKREAKWRNRQMYHMRHTRDYDTLGVPIGASKVDVKAAYKKLAGEPP